MKRKFVSVLLALVLVCSFSLVTAVPAGAATIDLAVNDENPWTDEAFTFENILPGGDPMEFDFKLHNVGDTPGILTFSMSYVENDMAGAPAPNMSADEFASLVYVEAVSYQFKWPDDPNPELPPEGYVGAEHDDLESWLGMDTIGNNDGKVSLYEICQVGIMHYDVEDDPLEATAEITYFIEFQLGDSLDPFQAGGDILTGEEDNSLQGDGISVTIIATLGDNIEQSSGNVFQAAVPVLNSTTDVTYGTIQLAIDAASEGDTISVAAGTYAENVVVDKALMLQGAEGATIAPATGCGVEIQASDITVDGFDINTLGLGAHGIYISVGATGLTLTGNDITIGGYSTAIYADAGASQTAKSSGWTISGNTLDAPAGCNLELYDVDAVTVDDNIFKNTAGSNVIVSSELFDMTGPIVFTNNDVQGCDLGSMVAFVTDFQQWVTVTRTDTVATTMDDVTITGNTFDGWASRGLRIGDWGGDVTNVVVNYNGFLSTGEALANKDAVAMDAEFNYWGSANGPAHEDNTFNVSSQGGVIIDLGDVDFVPWYDTDMEGDSFAPVTSSEDGDFSSIQAAIEAATGTTITCKAGTYTEDLYIDKSLTVQSEEGAITDEAEWEPVTRLDGDVVIELGWDGEDPLAETAVFDGFYIDGYDTGVPIYLEEVDNGSDLTISNNVLVDYFVGIMSDGLTTDNASSVTIEGNYIFDGGYGGCGIDFYEVVGGSELTIRDNEVFWNAVGIYIFYLAEESTLTIEDNLVADNDYGIKFYDVDESTVTIAGNTIGEGYSECMDMTLAPNWYVGICFDGITTVSDSTITIGGDTREEGNVIQGNGDEEEGGGGIFVYYMVASSLEILNNDILDNYSDGVSIGYFDEDSSVDIHYNSIAGNYDGVSYSSLYTIDATYNWWGDVAGPDTSAKTILHNPYENWTEGDAVSDGVDYLPWLIRIDLVTDFGGWNIVSFPIMGPEEGPSEPPEEIVGFYYFDSSTQYWGFDPYEADALDAMYFKVTAPISFMYPVSSEPTFPSQKAMKVGWNFVGLAELYEREASHALLDAYWGTGVAEDLTGYSKVRSPSLNGVSWTFLRPAIMKADSPPMLPCKGYWVLMVNDGILGGFTETPIVEVAVPPGPLL